MTTLSDDARTVLAFVESYGAGKEQRDAAAAARRLVEFTTCPDHPDAKTMNANAGGGRGVLLCVVCGRQLAQVAPDNPIFDRLDVEGGGELS